MQTHHVFFFNGRSDMASKSQKSNHKPKKKKKSQKPLSKTVGSLINSRKKFKLSFWEMCESLQSQSEWRLCEFIWISTNHFRSKFHVTNNHRLDIGSFATVKRNIILNKNIAAGSPVQETSKKLMLDLSYDVAKIQLQGRVVVGTSVLREHKFTAFEGESW